jgi:hypothetical protein
MPHRKISCCVVLACIGSASAFAQDPVKNLQDLVGARGRDGESQLEQRGYSFVRGEKAGDSSFTYWRETHSQRCVTVRTTDGRYQALVYAPASDCAGAGTASASNDAGSEDKATPDRFDTVCGVMVADKDYRYRCKAVDFHKDGRRVRTVLHYPDQKIKLVWRSGNTMDLHFEGMNPQNNVRYASSEGETNFQFEGKTYYYISDKDSARMEVQNFRE